MVSIGILQVCIIVDILNLVFRVWVPLLRYLEKRTQKKQASLGEAGALQ